MEGADKQLGDQCLWALPVTSPMACCCRKVLTLPAGVEGCGALDSLWPGDEPRSVPPTCQMARRAFPVSGRGLCPRPLILAKLNVADVRDLDFFSTAL